MSEKEKIIVNSVEKKGVFNFKELYTFSKKWLKDNGYLVIEERNNEDKENSIKKMIKWKNERKITDYYKLIIKVKFKTDMVKAKTKDGKNTNKGKVKIKLKGVLNQDWRKEWVGNPIFKFFRDFYNKYLIKNRVDKYRGMVRKDVEELANQLRKFLSIKTP